MEWTPRLLVRAFISSVIILSLLAMVLYAELSPGVAVGVFVGIAAAWGVFRGARRVKNNR